jgi:SAM-dependent methyltransferase
MKQPGGLKVERGGFDSYAYEYEELVNSGIAFFGEKHDYFHAYKLSCLQRWIAGIEYFATILDFGCGTGKLAALMAQTFRHASVYGYDVSSRSLELARARCGGLENLTFGDSFTGHQFDLIVAANVFHHIKPEDRKRVVLQLRDALKPTGRMVIFEHNPLNPLTRWVVKACPFDADAELLSALQFIRLAGSCDLEVDCRHYIVFFPKFLSFFRRLEFRLGFFPLGAQYMLSLKQGTPPRGCLR